MKQSEVNTADRYISLDSKSIAEKILKSCSSGKSWATSKMSSLFGDWFEHSKESIFDALTSTELFVVDTPGLMPKESRNIQFDSKDIRFLRSAFDGMHLEQADTECGYKTWQEVYRGQSRFHAINNIMLAPDILAYAEEKARSMITKENIIQPIVSDRTENTTYESLVNNLIKDLEDRRQTAAKNGSLIGNRVFNGRKVEKVFDDVDLTDEKFLEISEAVSMKYFQQPIEELQVSTRSKFTAALMVAFKEFNPHFDCFGKLAYIFRMLQEKAKEKLKCGLRYIQKSVAWLKSMCSNRNALRELKEQLQQGSITQHAYEKFKDWRDLKDRLVDFLNEALPQFAAV